MDTVPYGHRILRGLKNQPNEAKQRKTKKARRRWTRPGWWLIVCNAVMTHSSQMALSAETNIVRTCAAELPQKPHLLSPSARTDCFSALVSQHP